MIDIPKTLQLRTFVYLTSFDSISMRTREIDDLKYYSHEESYTLLHEFDHEIDMPSMSKQDLVTRKVETLQRGKLKEQAEHQVKMDNMEEQIQNLLCIEYDEGENEDD